MRIVRLEDVTSLPELKTNLTPEELKQAYKLARESFTAADLQKYTEFYDDVPMEDMLDEMEENQRNFDERNKDGK